MPASSLLCGESGILLVAWRLAPSTELAETLLERVRENVANEAEELMWGSPGTLLAAHAMHEWTGEERWARSRAEHGRGRYSLFTGDVGVALFAGACLDADARFPVLDGWD